MRVLRDVRPVPVAVGLVLGAALAAPVVVTKSDGDDRVAAQRRATVAVERTAAADHQELLGRIAALEAELAAARRANDDLTARLDAAAEQSRAAHVRASRSRRDAIRITRNASHVAAGALRTITMYCDTGSRTSSGKWPEPGMVAVLDRSIPFGTRVVIDGLGTFTVEDWIGRGSEFDIFTHSCAEADRFGRQHRRVTVR